MDTCANIEKPFAKNHDELTGRVVSVDHFGNLITNIGKGNLEKFAESDMTYGITVSICGKQISGLAGSYGECEPNEALGIIGSKGYLEISVNCGNAAKFFNARKGDPVRVVRNNKQTIRRPDSRQGDLVL